MLYEFVIFCLKYDELGEADTRREVERTQGILHGVLELDLLASAEP